MGRIYSALVSILLRTFRAWVVPSALGTEVAETALRCAAVACSAVPLSTNLIGTSVWSPTLFLFAGPRLVSCPVVLKVAGLEMAESTDVGEFNMFDFPNESTDRLVQVNDFGL